MKYQQSLRSDQSEVWNDISEKACRMEVTSETDAMADIFHATRVDLDACVANMPPVGDQVGAVFLIGDKVAGIDLFGCSAMCRKLLPKLIRSYALDAIETPEPRPYNEKVVDEFLNKVAKEHTDASPAIGLGTDHRFDDDGLVGGALVLNGTIVHLAALPSAAT
tara:strand:- start:238 stop:729 length:492 start_codon:yes stop_codon:yes gene_type:complete